MKFQHFWLQSGKIRYCSPLEKSAIVALPPGKIRYCSPQEKSSRRSYICMRSTQMVIQEDTTTLLGKPLITDNWNAHCTRSQQLILILVEWNACVIHWPANVQWRFLRFSDETKRSVPIYCAFRLAAMFY